MMARYCLKVAYNFNSREAIFVIAKIGQFRFGNQQTCSGFGLSKILEAEAIISWSKLFDLNCSSCDSNNEASEVDLETFE